MVRGSGGEVRETSDICGTISDQWAEDEVKGGCEVREQSGGAKSVRPLARQGACGLDPSIRTLSKDAPGDQGESQRTTGRFEVPGVSMGLVSKGGWQEWQQGRHRETERRSPSPRFSLSSQVSTESL